MLNTYKFITFGYTYRFTLLHHSFDLTGANVLPCPPLSASTSSSTFSKTHVHPSSLTSHLIPYSSPAAGSSLHVPSSHAFLSPNTWLSTWGPTPCCARKHVIAIKLVVMRPTVAPSLRGGSVKRPPYSLFMIKTGRSGCASPSFCSSFVSSGR